MRIPFGFLTFGPECGIDEAMNARRGCITLAVVSFALCCCACNRGHNAQAAQAAPAGASQSSQVKSSVPPPPPAIPAPATGVTSTVATEAPKAEASPANVVVADRSQTLTVAGRAYRFLSHVQSTPANKEETVEWWELRDGDDHVLYRESYGVAFQNGSFESTVDIRASSYAGQGGGGILIQGYELPSAPDAGGWVQVFAFKYGRDKYGADPSLFRAFGPPIYVEGEFLGLEKEAQRPTPVSFGGAREMVSSDVLNFRLWTGNFNVTYAVRINYMTGILEPAWRCIETTSKGRVDRCSYPVAVEAHREDQPTFVRLFPEPDDGFTAKHVVVQPQSHIEYIEARVPIAWNQDEKAISFSVNGDMWLKVRIDGQEGWIHSEEDFQAVGLPMAG